MSRPLIYQGSDVRLVRRTGARGQVVVEFLHKGRPSGHVATAWPHELRNHPGGLAGIKRAIADLPHEDDPAPPRADDSAPPAANPIEPPQEPRPRGFLQAHYAAGTERED